MPTELIKKKKAAIVVGFDILDRWIFTTKQPYIATVINKKVITSLDIKLLDCQYLLRNA